MKSYKSNDSSQLKSAAGSFQKAAPYINITYVLLASILMMGALGWWLDSLFSTRPILVVIGVLSGLFLGFYNLFKVVKKLDKKDS
jgi:F0F1-type ATP synthase assembly protein I